ncbi:hypothetical protein [Autumnicola psychrophila]|uniref:Uncharacterized protein n=1 Tax=Autumnicola psychrophila TaxID=3075592 RepID=A0ABU3DSL5_9FLAO|nr:hypothetical protein [Zunongwangia sp. F225]MDT0686623.1 hypothetical protein [Zunongwangia sp. F225]
MSSISRLIKIFQDSNFRVIATATFNNIYTDGYLPFGSCWDNPTEEFMDFSPNLRPITHFTN